jgi:hypothetical protein
MASRYSITASAGHATSWRAHNRSSACARTASAGTKPVSPGGTEA